MKNLIIIASLLLSLPIMAQTKVVKKNAVKANNFGITYSLPKTSLVVDAEVTPELYHLPPNSQEEYQIHLEYWKNAKPGKYRIIKEFMLSQYNEISKEDRKQRKSS